MLLTGCKNLVDLCSQPMMRPSSIVLFKDFVFFLLAVDLLSSWNVASCYSGAKHGCVTTLFTERKLILMASKLCFVWTHVLTINQGLEEVSWWQHNAPDVPINTWVRGWKKKKKQKKQASGGYAFEVCLYCFSQIKEAGAFVVRGWRNVKKKLPFCVIISSFILVSPWKGHALYLQENAQLHYLLV